MITSNNCSAPTEGKYVEMWLSPGLCNQKNISHDLPLSWIILLRCSRHRVFNALFFGGPILCGNTTLVSTTVLCMICKKLHPQHWLRTTQDKISTLLSYSSQMCSTEKGKVKEKTYEEKDDGSGSGRSSSKRYITLCARTHASTHTHIYI
jgi:hypothetical protein